MEISDCRRGGSQGDRDEARGKYRCDPISDSKQKKMPGDIGGNTVFQFTKKGEDLSPEQKMARGRM